MAPLCIQATSKMASQCILVTSNMATWCICLKSRALLGEGDFGLDKFGWSDSIFNFRTLPCPRNTKLTFQFSRFLPNFFLNETRSAATALLFSLGSKQTCEKNLGLAYT